MDVKATPRVEDLGCWSRIWIDITVNGKPFQSLIWASASSDSLRIEDAEAFVSGDFSEKELKSRMKGRRIEK